VTELNATWTAVVTEVAERGLDPLAALHAEVDLVLTHLLEDPIVRGGTRVPSSPPQLHAAQAAGMLRPCLDRSGCAELARFIMDTIVGHHMICDLSAEDQLRGRVTAMLGDLLPLVTQQH
jgi:hypothetical protein